MKTKKASETSSPSRYEPKRRVYDYIVPNKTPPWYEWLSRRIYNIEYNGVQFKAALRDGELIMGTHLRLQGGWFAGVDLVYPVSVSSGARDHNSCAFSRISPHGETPDRLAMFMWWLNNVRISRGAVAYITPHDANENYPDRHKSDVAATLRAVMCKRGFRVVAVSRSRMGAYNVWMLVHPSDQVLKSKKSTTVDFDDDLLAIATADCDSPGYDGNSVGSNKPAGVVQDAPASPAGVLGTSGSGRHFVSIG